MISKKNPDSRLFVYNISRHMHRKPKKETYIFNILQLFAERQPRHVSNADSCYYIIISHPQCEAFHVVLQCLQC